MSVHFELTSDREVQIMGIGVLPANEPVEVDEQAERLFEIVHGTKISKANFAPYVSVTAVVTDDAEGGE